MSGMNKQRSSEDERIILGNSVIGIHPLLKSQGILLFPANKGLGIGMTICVAISIVLSELGGYHDIIPLSIIAGSTVGLFIGTILERQSRKQKAT